MSDVAFQVSFANAFEPISELRRRQPELASVGLAFLTLAAVGASFTTIDPRMLDGVSVWAKPAKFFLSSGVLMLTSGWFYGYVRPDRRASRRLVVSARVLIACAIFELGYISLQAALGERSHFNRADPAHFALYGLMGAAAIGMLATKIPLALEIAQRPVAGLDPDFRRAVVIGLSLTVTLGTLTGLYMSQQYGQGHNVGAVGGAAPLFGWNRAGGDLRVAHFFGMHSEQIVPVVAAAAGLWLGGRWRRRATFAAAVLILAITALVFAQAVMGRPFPM